ncbi:MAG: hypothetical protein KGL50_09325, partial [Burkholderiales bacterium]|nr:hypothetical protein [Burkholderiales bacterium]
PGTDADFNAARQAIARHDDHGAASALRRAEAVLAQASAHAGADVRQALDAARAGLEHSAQALDRGTQQSARVLDHAYARADHALALAQREQAAEAWSRQAYRDSGRDLQAAAAHLDSAGDWAGGQAKSAAHAASADAHAVGDKLARGGTWARDEVARGFDTLGQGLDALGRAVGVHTAARPVKLAPPPAHGS